MRRSFAIGWARWGTRLRSAATHMILMAQLSRWLVAENLDASRLSADRVVQFLSANRAEGHRFPKSSRGAGRLISFLRGRGVIPDAPVAVLSASERLVERFGRFLVTERGLAAGTIVNHRHAAGLFLASLEPVVLEDLGRLEPAHVHRFVLAEAQRRSVA